MKSFSALSAAGRRLFVRQDDRRLCAPWAAARPRDRHTRASLGVLDLEARPGLAAAHGTEWAGITARSPARPRRRGELQH